MAGLIIAVPVFVTLIAGLVNGGGDAWSHIRDTLLVGYTGGTLGMLALTGIMILITAVPAAWLVTMYQFPGRGVFEWLLILPLAAPGYVLAYAYADLMGLMGPFQVAIRDVTGLSARDYWFPDMRNLPGLAFLYIHKSGVCLYQTLLPQILRRSIAVLRLFRIFRSDVQNSGKKVAHLFVAIHSQVCFNGPSMLEKESRFHEMVYTSGCCRRVCCCVWRAD